VTSTNESAEIAPPSRRPRWPWVVAGAVLLFVMGLIAGGLFRPYVYNGAVIQSSASAPPMDGLVYSTGEEVDIEALQGDVVLIYFGYTFCPDLCPTMLATVDRAMESLGEKGSRITTMMVTVDPSRDTIDGVGDYVRIFNDEFRGVWGEEDSVRSVATQYGVTFEYDEPDEDGYYLVAHTASLIAVDPEGALRLLYPVGVTVEELAADLGELLR